MPGRKRSPEERAEIEAIARQMRIDGVDMVTISKAVDVSIATLYLWAKQSGWREQDLPRPALVLPEVRPSNEALPLAPEEPVLVAEAANQALGLAARFAAAGDLVQAEKAARLSERFLRLKEAEIRPGADDAEAEDEVETYADIRDNPGYQLGRLLGTMMDNLYRGNLGGLPAWALAALHTGDRFGHMIGLFLGDCDEHDRERDRIEAEGRGRDPSIVSARQLELVRKAHESIEREEAYNKRLGIGRYRRTD
ncbi:hypothetical protein [Maricaulis sp.]|uniref:hypothetical protein n=1 Tax=Maricaulis sp. TaxID=1486257 RepID=UPI002621760A|nr:hypothetical protein [Maricaulis sp.]